MTKLLVKLLFTITILTTSILVNAQDFAQLESQDFSKFLSQIKEIAIKKGIKAQTIDVAFSNISLNNEVLDLDKKQPEFSLTFGRYLASRLSQTRLDNAKKQYHQQQKILSKIQQEYGVPKRILLAFWGLETNFGNNTGTFGLIEALATLAFDQRRRTFFTKELLFALMLIDNGAITQDAHSSWAGAMGYMQFMPSNVATYGVDRNHNGLNLWGDLPDVFASGANFLKKIGWHQGERWGREVILPEDFDYYLAELHNKKPLSYWQSKGVKKTTGKDLPKSSLLGSIILPSGHQGPAFLVYRNFHAILNWNRSIFYALSVVLLADRIISDTLLHTPPIVEPYIEHKVIVDVQKKLNSLGFLVGKADGIIGPKTRTAVRDFQNLVDSPADGHIDQSLIQLLAIVK